MQNEDQQLKEQLASLPLELRRFISSDELERKINLLSKKHGLTGDMNVGLSNEISLVLMQLDSVDSLHTNFQRELGLSDGRAGALAVDVEQYVLAPVEKYLVKNKTDFIVENEDNEEEIPPTPPIEKQQDLPEELPTRQSILDEIENPPRTVLKRYVLEHEPITDPEHLIDDTVDTRIKLE